MGKVSNHNDMTFSFVYDVHVVKTEFIYAATTTAAVAHC